MNNNIVIHFKFCMNSVSHLKRCYVSLLHTAALGLSCDLSQTFQLSPPGVSKRVTMREHPAAEGGTADEKCPEILPKCRFTLYIQGSFICRKATTWGPRLYFPSEGRRAEDFFRPKNPMALAGCEPANQRPARYLQTTEAALFEEIQSH